MAERLDLKFSDVVNDINSAAGRIVVDPNNPTIEGQQAVQAWLEAHPGYNRNGANTSKYMAGYQPPQDTPSVNNRALTPEEQYAMAQADAKVHGTPTYDPELVAQNQANREKELSTQLSQEKTLADKAHESIANLNSGRDTDAFDKGLKAWSPLAPSFIKGGDRSGEAAGYRAAAGIEDKAAADNAKILQWNKQRATDNRLADKIAAAQAESQWKQNANALGAEGGASVVASQNQAVTPDIMAEKNYQSQQMATATQNLAEVNARKLAAQDDRINADRTDYNTQLEESQNAYKYNLATGDNKVSSTSKNKDTSDNASESTPENKDTSDNASDTKKTATEDEQNTGPVAESNKHIKAEEDATQITADTQAVEKLIEEVNDLNSAQTPDTHIGRDGKQMTKAEHYALIEDEYNKIKARTPSVGNLPSLLVPSGNIAASINDITN